MYDYVHEMRKCSDCLEDEDDVENEDGVADEDGVEDEDGVADKDGVEDEEDEELFFLRAGGSGPGQPSG